MVEMMLWGLHPLPPSTQGLQVLTDIHNGFSGLVSSSLEGLADEYGARKIVVVVCYPTALDNGQVTLGTHALSLASTHTPHVLSHAHTHTLAGHEQPLISSRCPLRLSSTVPWRWSGSWPTPPCSSHSVWPPSSGLHRPIPTICHTLTSR